MTEVANRIFALVKAKKFTQKEFAKRCGVSEKIVSQWKGSSQSYKNYLPQIANALGVTVDELMKDEKEGPADNDGTVEERVTPQEQYLLRLFRLVPKERQADMLLAVELTLRNQGLL